MKKFIQCLLTLSLVLSLIACSNQAQDEKIAEVLPSCLLKRNEYVEENKGEDSYEYYQHLVELEEPTLKFDGKTFNNIHYQEYIDALNQQKESLEYYDSDYYYYLDLWNDGGNKRFEAVYELINDEEFTMPKDYILSVIKEFSEVDLINQIGSSDGTYNEKEKKYDLDLSIENASKYVLKDLILNISIDDTLHSFSKDEWKSKEAWDIHVKLDHEIKDYDSIEVTLIRIKDSGSTSIDLTDEYETNFEDE